MHISEPDNASTADGWAGKFAEFVRGYINIILDVGLFISVVLMLASSLLVFFFHMVFLLLVIGAFYWNLRSFVIRSVVWVSVVCVILIISITAGETHPDEFSEIPLLTAMLWIVFYIARRRVNAEDALRAANEGLEAKVAARTDDLMGVNLELTREITLHQKTEKTLRESEDRYRRLVELSFDAVAIHRDGDIVDINSRGVKLLGGSSREEIVGQPILQFIHPDYVETVENRVQRQTIAPGRGVPLIEEKFIRVDGSVIDVEVAAVPVTIKGRSAIQTVIRDITPRKRAEAERERLLATEREQRILAETLGDVFLALAAQTSRQNVLNEILKQARRIVSYSAANIVLLHGDTLKIAQHHGYDAFGSQHVLANLQQSLTDLPLDNEIVKTRSPIVVPDTHDNRNWVTAEGLSWIRSYVAVPICLGEQVLGLLRLDSELPNKFSIDDVDRLQPLVHAAAIVLENTRLYDQARQEISDRIQAEQALRVAVAKNQAILDAISDTIFQVHHDGRVLDYKIQEDRPSEWQQKVLQGKQTLPEIFPAKLAGKMLEHIALALETDSMQIFEYELPTNNSVTHLEFRLVPVGKDDVFLLLADLTDYKIAQAALEKERSRIARDLHDSLGQNLGYLRLKLDQYSMDGFLPDAELLRQELQLMRDVANEAYELVRSMLAAARPSNSMALNAVLLAQAQSSGSRARFKVVFDSQGEPYSLPPIVQQQVLFICHEALNNIEKHAGAKTVRILLEWKNDDLTISLSDDGQGFYADVPVEVDHFGLAIMQERATEINGRLTISSTPGKGTNLLLRVPLYQSALSTTS